jgi:hypothetical protein
MNSGDLVGAIICTSMFGMIFGIVYLYNKQKMAMIERGMDPRAYRTQPAPFKYLKWAFLLMGAGLGLFLASILSYYVFTGIDGKHNPAIYFSLIGIFGGLGLFISYLIEKKETIDKKNNRLEE